MCYFHLYRFQILVILFKKWMEFFQYTHIYNIHNTPNNTHILLFSRRRNFNPQTISLLKNEEQQNSRCTTHREHTTYNKYSAAESMYLHHSLKTTRDTRFHLDFIFLLLLYLYNIPSTQIYILLYSSTTITTTTNSSTSQTNLGCSREPKTKPNHTNEQYERGARGC